MSRNIQAKTKYFLNEILPKLSKEEIRDLQEGQHQDNIKEFEDFKLNYEKGKCYICHNTLNYFNPNMPCLHWLLRKNRRIKKDYILLALKNSGAIQAQAYMRWVANEETKLTNINDLKDEVVNSEYLNCTIRYKEIEWTIWCSARDFQGHKGKNTDFPHWHLQMQINGNRFISFSDFHIPLSDYDIFSITAINESQGKIKHSFFGGGSTQDIFDHFTPDEILENLTGGHGKDKAKAPFNISTVVLPEEGKLISGDDIADAIEEAKKNGEPISVALKRKLSDANVRSIVSPSKNIPEFKTRSGRKKKD